MPVVDDMLGRRMHVPDVPQRIVSLVPSQTELLADLGLEGEVVGITKFCVHPERWFREKVRVGGTKTVHIDRVAALKPDLIIANKEENVLDQINTLSAIAPVWVSDIHTLHEAHEMIRAIGQLTCCSEKANEVSERIGTLFGALGERVRLSKKYSGFVSLTNNSPLWLGTYKYRKVAYGIWREPWMWAGDDTFIHDILQHCGWENVLKGHPRYPEMDLKALVELAPELVLLSSEPYPFKDKHITEVAETLPGAKILLVDGEMFSWYGSRLLRAPEYLAGLLQSL